MTGQEDAAVSTAGSYTKAKLVAELAAASSLTKASVGRVLDRFTEIAYREAVNGFVVPGICKLKVVRKKASRRRNPVTGRMFLIGERNGLKVVPLKRAKTAIVPNTGVVVQLLAEEEPQVQVIEDPVAASPAPGGAVPTPAAPSPAAPASPLVNGEEGQIVFPCSECGSMLAAPPKMAGQQGECPFCGAGTRIPNRTQDVTKPEKQVVSGAGGGAMVSDFILFVCRACGQEIEAPADMVGMSIECPTCATSLVVPIASGGTEPAPMPEVKTPEEKTPNRSSMTIRIDLSDLE